jgi:hypothetical protein
MFGPHAHANFQSALFEVGDWVKNKRGTDNGGRSEQQKALAVQTNTIRLRADQCTLECNVLALTLAIEPKQKHVAALTNC